jgi:valyl-tRNA synthetase
MTLIQDVIVSIRNIRSEMNISPAKKMDVVLKISEERLITLFRVNAAYLRNLARVDQVTIGKDVTKPPMAASAVVSGMEVYIPLEGIIDVNIERSRLQKEVDRLTGQVEAIDKKLGNRDFVAKAPSQVIEKENAKRDNFRRTIEKLSESLRQLG